MEREGQTTAPPGDPSSSSLPASEEIIRPHEEKQPQHQLGESKPQQEPNGGYGWVCVACTAFINAHTWGVNSSYGVFLSYYLSNNVFAGASYLDYAFVGGLSIAAAMLISPLATYTTKRFGTRTTLLTGVFFETLSLITASFANQIWHLFLSQGACFGLGMGFLFVGTVGIIPQWFTTKRSLANGIGTAGSGLGGLTYSLATGAMINSIGLPWAFRILGIVSFAVNFICSILIKDRNKILGANQVPFDYRLFKRREYCLFELWAFFSILGYVVLLFSLPDFALSVGLTSQQGAIIGALLNLGQAVGRPLVGIFSDRAGRINIAALLTFVCGLFCFVIWIFAKSFGVLIFFSLIVGTVAGTIWTTIAPVGAEVVGLKELPSALSITWVVVALPSLFSEPIGLGIRQASENDYLYVIIYTGVMYILAAVSGWFLRAWKIGELEMLAAEKGEPIGQLDATQAHVIELNKTTSRELRARRSQLLKRLLACRRV